MDAESSTGAIHSRVGRGKEITRGIERELLSISTSALCLMSGKDDNRVVGLVRLAPFFIRMVTQNRSPIMVSVCVVGELVWPITKDSPILRVGLRSFAFGMPAGLLYGLQFPQSCSEEAMEKLERLLIKFGYYEDHSVRQTGIQFSRISEHQLGFWTASQSKIERITEPLLKGIGANREETSILIHSENDRIRRVKRMSAITKMITKGILIGVINPHDHIQIIGPSSSASDEDDDDVDSRASATIFVFSDLVEAVEASGVILLGNIESMPKFRPTWTPVPKVTFWNINKFGLIMILQLIISATTENNELTVESTENTQEKTGVIDQMKEDPKIETKSKEVMEEDPSPRLQEIKFPIMDKMKSYRRRRNNKNNIAKLGHARANMEFNEENKSG